MSKLPWRRVAIWLALVGLLIGSIALPAAAQESQVEQPARAFGVTIGDVLTQRVPIAPEVDVEGVLQRAVEALPAGRIGAWLSRREVTLGTTGAGVPALVFEYQVVNSPVEAMTVRLPPLRLGTDLVEVAEWPFALVPLTPQTVGGEGDLLAMQPDRRLLPLATDTRKRRLAATAWALAAAALAWGLWWWWRERTDRVRLPFAQARHALRRLPAARRDDSPEAWTALHRALNDTAGGTVHRGSLDALLSAAPWLGSSRDAIEKFFEASAVRFFAQDERRDAPFKVSELAQTLYRLEKQNSR